MTVYVDDAHIPAAVKNGLKVHRSTWSHMMADDVDELVAFATRLGLRRAWLQWRRSGVHFDVTAPKRAQAVRAGAVQIEAGSEQWQRVVARAREQYQEGDGGR